jgi:hypothetical protein
MQTLDNIAAIRLAAASAALRSAADALDDLDDLQARAKASELRGAATIADQWIAVLQARHEAQQPEDELL